jgi:hypothetical protein
MDDVKLPDLKRLREVKQRIKELPPQKSPTDTSNWENRKVPAPFTDPVTKKRSVRELDFILAADPNNSNLLTIAQAERLEKQKRNKKPSR